MNPPQKTKEMCSIVLVHTSFSLFFPCCVMHLPKVCLHCTKHSYSPPVPKTMRPKRTTKIENLLVSINDIVLLGHDSSVLHTYIARY